MATPGDLIALLSMELGISAPTIFQHDRNLVDGGWRPVKGRGRSAVSVTPEYAANLLTSLLGSERVKGSQDVVRHYRNTGIFKVSPREGMASDWAGCGIEELENLPNDHCFVDALAAFIDAGMSGSLLGFLGAEAKDDSTEWTRVLFPFENQVEITAVAPFMVGTFNIRSSRSIFVRYVRPIFDDEPRPWPNVDLVQRKTISAKTTLTIGGLLSQ